MADRDRQNAYWNEQHDWRDRLGRREGQQQSWQGRPESQWTRESDYTARRDEWQRDYDAGQNRNYGGERPQPPYGDVQQSGWETSYGGGWQSGYGGAWQTGYGADTQSGYSGREQARTVWRRGPKNYKRSDERIREDVCERIMQSDLDASDVTVTVVDGKVTLEGTVPDRGMKHRMEDIAEQSFGVTDVDNNIRVARHDRGTSWTGRSESSLVDGLNRCLRSELSAIETFRQALDRDRNEFGTSTEFQRLSHILRDHEEAASRLREAVRRAGGEPSTDSGAWGTWSKIVMGAAKLFGDKSAYKALKEGEESGYDEYNRFQRECQPSAQLFDLVSELMGRQQQHIRELDSLMAAADRR